jgi:mortality factor 4-like protein 1
MYAFVDNSMSYFSFSKSKRARKKQDKGSGSLASDSEKSTKREEIQGSGPTRRKRSRLNNVENDENYVSRLDVKVKIPDDLKQWLVDDWDLITRQKQLVPLPRKKTIADILDEYAKYRAKNPNGVKPGVAQEVVNGVQEYFNVMLGTQLLYKFERPQYGDLLAENPNLPMSQIYGSEHLLRLFVKLGNALSYSNLEDKSIRFIVGHIHDCLDYMAANADGLFATDYETATPEYHRRAAA